MKKKKEKTINDLFKYINSRKYAPHFIETIKPFNENYENYYIYRNIDGKSSNFTDDELYLCGNPDDLEAVFNFTDDRGVENGYSTINHKYFTRVSKQYALLHFARKTYLIGTVFNTLFGDIKTIKIDNDVFQFKDNNNNATNNLCVNFLNEGELKWATIYCDEKGWAEIITPI